MSDLEGKLKDTLGTVQDRKKITKLESELSKHSKPRPINEKIVIITLHKEATNYLKEINEKVRPFEVDILRIEQEYKGIIPRKTGRMKFGFNAEKDSRRFIESVFKIHNSYQNVELVLAYSIYSSAGSGFFINDKISDKINDYFQLISKKRIMLLDVLYDPEVEHVLKYDEKFHTPEEEVKRVVEKSLEFRTF